jgi:hypothetical protein
MVGEEENGDILKKNKKNVCFTLFFCWVYAYSSFIGYGFSRGRDLIALKGVVQELFQYI